RVDAISRSGARGLMQLMPATARRMSRQLGVPHSIRRLTADPDHNIRLGSAYLARMLDRFDGSYILAVAAYNAGPTNVDKWLEQFGDPRRPGVGAIDWIESMPFHETRNYVQRVLENTQVYRLRRGEAPSIGTLERDIAR
ncbi:MAG: lytic transglycosylase domain-containing protein, partial [Inquilinus sp.]|nr:lytic transglycosylase domain-containing protein [Inquilinus sp.]